MICRQIVLHIIQIITNKTPHPPRLNILRNIFTAKYTKNCSAQRRNSTLQTVQMSKCWMLINFQLNSNIPLLLESSYCVLLWRLVVQDLKVHKSPPHITWCEWTDGWTGTSAHFIHNKTHNYSQQWQQQQPTQT